MGGLLVPKLCRKPAQRAILSVATVRHSFLAEVKGVIKTEDEKDEQLLPPVVH